MSIEIETLKIAVDSLVNSIKDKIEKESESTMYKYVAVNELSIIAS